MNAFRAKEIMGQVEATSGRDFPTSSQLFAKEDTILVFGKESCRDRTNKTC